MALRVEKQRADPGEGPSSQRTYQLPALDLESADWRRLSDEISDGKTDLVQIVESPAWHDAQEQTSQNVGSKQKATDPASSKTEVPSPSEQTPETVLKRFRPAHFSQPYRDQQEFDIMSRGFFGKQPELNLRYKASSYDPESSSRLNEQKSFFDAPPSEETEFHDQVYRSLTKYLAECKRNSTMNLTAHASPQIPPSNDNHMRKDSKWADGGVPPNFQDNESVQESAQIPSSLEDGMGDTTMSTLKNALPFLESSGDQSTIKAAKSHRPNLKSAEQAGFRHSSYEGNTSSMGSAAGGPMPRATNSHRPQAFRHSEIPHGSYSPMMTGARPKAMDKRSSTAEGKAANSAKLVPYGTGQAPIDIFTYDAHKSARPTMHRAPGSPNSEHTMEGKKVTSKGVNMSGALGVPPTLLRPKQAKHGSFSSSGDQRKARDNPSPQCVSGASAEATHTTPPKEIPRKPVGTANQEPDVTLLKPLKHATPSVQEGKREKGLKKFVGKLAKKASTIGNENGSGSILARHPSPYPFIEDIEPKKDLSLPRKLSRKLTKKSREDLQFQSHIHPALRTAPQHVGTKDRSKLVDNGNRALGLIPDKDSIGRRGRGRYRADC